MVSNILSAVQDQDDGITVTKITIEDESCYLMIRWRQESFELYLYVNEAMWKGQFSANRLAGFSKNLQMSTAEYYSEVKKCLSRQKDDYRYDLKNGFFLWKRIVNDAERIEGFLPVELDISPRHLQPDLVDILVTLNKRLREKISGLNYKFQTTKSKYHACIKDTEDFLNLKMEMERAICEKFLNVIGSKDFEAEPQS